MQRLILEVQPWLEFGTNWCHAINHVDRRRLNLKMSPMGDKRIAMTKFEWTPKREKAAIALAAGYTQREAAEQAGVARATRKCSCVKVR